MEISEEDINKNLLTHENGPVDLMIRTGGDHRLSNFLLWQSAYAELFSRKHNGQILQRLELFEILKNFSLIDRRFGKLKPEDSQLLRLSRSEKVLS